jgi:hypothetical protein
MRASFVASASWSTLLTVIEAPCACSPPTTAGAGPLTSTPVSGAMHATSLAVGTVPVDQFAGVSHEAPAAGPTHCVVHSLLAQALALGTSVATDAQRRATNAAARAFAVSLSRLSRAWGTMRLRCRDARQSRRLEWRAASVRGTRRYSQQAVTLSVELLEAWLARWRVAGSPLVDAWRPGLSEREITAISEEHQVRLPPELLTWWAWRDGANPVTRGERSGRLFVNPSTFSPLPLTAALEQTRDHRDLITELSRRSGVRSTTAFLSHLRLWCGPWGCSSSGGSKRST